MQLGSQIGDQRRIVEYLRRELAFAGNPAERALVERRLTTEATKLVGLMSGARRRLTRTALPGGGAVEELPPELVPMRSGVLQRELLAVAGALQKVKKLYVGKKGGTAARHHLRLQFDMLAVRKKVLEQRLALLRTGRDLERPRRLDPSKVEVQRSPLSLPHVYSVPAPVEIKAIIHTTARGLRRMKGEPDRAFRLRLRSYVQRALVRYIDQKTSGVPLDEALARAVAETLHHDRSALEAESREGGVAADMVAEAVDPAIDGVSTELDVAMEELHPPVPVSPLEAEDVDAVLIDAEAMEAELAGPVSYGLAVVSRVAVPLTSVHPVVSIVGTGPASTVVAAPAAVAVPAFVPVAAPVASAPASTAAVFVPSVYSSQAPVQVATVTPVVEEDFDSEEGEPASEHRGRRKRKKWITPTVLVIVGGVVVVGGITLYYQNQRS